MQAAVVAAGAVRANVKRSVSAGWAWALGPAPQHHGRRRSGGRRQQRRTMAVRRDCSERRAGGDGRRATGDGQRATATAAAAAQQQQQQSEQRAANGGLQGDVELENVGDAPFARAWPCGSALALARAGLWPRALAPPRLPNDRPRPRPRRPPPPTMSPAVRPAAPGSRLPAPSCTRRCGRDAACCVLREPWDGRPRPWCARLARGASPGRVGQVEIASRHLPAQEPGGNSRRNSTSCKLLQFARPAPTATTTTTTTTASAPSRRPSSRPAAPTTASTGAPSAARRHAHPAQIMPLSIMRVAAAPSASPSSPTARPLRAGCRSRPRPYRARLILFAGCLRQSGHSQSPTGSSLMPTHSQ